MIENMKVRRFKEEDAQEVRNLIVRNFLEINSRDYGLSAMETLAKVYDEEKVLNVASYAHMYVFEFEEKIVGTGSISSFWGSETESILLSIFVLPEFHGKGVGRKIINILETDEFYVRAAELRYRHPLQQRSFIENLDMITKMVLRNWIMSIIIDWKSLRRQG